MLLCGQDISSTYYMYVDMLLLCMGSSPDLLHSSHPSWESQGPGVPRGGNLLWTHSRGLNNYNNIHGLIMSKLLVHNLACFPYLAAQLQLAQCMNIIIISITSSCKHFLGRTQTIICTDTAACIVSMYTILLNCWDVTFPGPSWVQSCMYNLQVSFSPDPLWMAP